MDAEGGVGQAYRTNSRVSIMPSYDQPSLRFIQMGVCMYAPELKLEGF